MFLHNDIFVRHGCVKYSKFPRFEIRASFDTTRQDHHHHHAAATLQTLVLNVLPRKRLGIFAENKPL